MTDPRDKCPPSSQPAPGLNFSPASEKKQPEVQITLSLPSDMVAAVHRVTQALPNQPIEQKVLLLLQQALQTRSPGGAIEEPLQSNPLASQPQSSQSANSGHGISDRSRPQELEQELAQIKQRLSLLEAVLPRLEAGKTGLDQLPAKPLTSPPKPPSAPQIPSSQPQEIDSAETELPQLPQGNPTDNPIVNPTVNPIVNPTINPIDKPSFEQTGFEQTGFEQTGFEQKGNPGSAVASIWMQVQQSDRPPASIPSTLQSIEPCPNCKQRLMPFKSSGLLRCIGCGWTRPLGSEADDETNSEIPDEIPAKTGVPDVDIHHLLERAAAESVENMKPRKRSS